MIGSHNINRVSSLRFAEVCFTICAGLVFGQQVSAEETFHIDETDDQIRIQESGRPVFVYQKSVKSQAGRYARNHYLHPVWDLEGIVLTEDFPTDHLHHRGIFWAWHQVRVDGRNRGDAWLCRNFQWDIQSTRIDTSRPTQLSLHLHMLWKSPDYRDAAGKLIPMVDERTVITLHKSTENERRIDFQIDLTALTDNVSIGGSEDVKGYGGFSVRIKMPDDLEFRAKQGTLQPQTQGIQAGGWVDLSATFDAAKNSSGLTIVQAPRNPGFPQPWILRQKRSMQNAAYPGRHPITLSKTAPTRLGYSVIIHRGKEVPSEPLSQILSLESHQSTKPESNR